jgi:hypothetical protein
MRYAYFKAARRAILEALYETYITDPLATVNPDELMGMTGLNREDLVVNIHYLGDRGLVEVMIGYNPPLFTTARIRPSGIDIVEDPFRLNHEFPPANDDEATIAAELPVLVERLVAEVDLAPVTGHARQRMLRDVQFLRDELSRRPEAWRLEVIDEVSSWLENEAGHTRLPALEEIRATARRVFQNLEDES